MMSKSLINVTLVIVVCILIAIISIMYDVNKDKVKKPQYPIVTRIPGRMNLKNTLTYEVWRVQDAKHGVNCLIFNEFSRGKNRRNSINKTISVGFNQYVNVEELNYIETHIECKL